MTNKVMKKDILLSICVPTYNRPERIADIIQQVSKIKGNYIELIIGDDNPDNNKTENIIIQSNVPNIRYFHNKKNLGMDANVLKIISKAKGEFIYILMDDDDIEIKNVPWILETIKNNNNISQIAGSIGDKRPGFKKIFFKYKCGHKIFKKGIPSIKELLFVAHHASGIILRKDSLNLKEALNFIGFFWIQQVLIAQAMINGDTKCTSKILSHFGKHEYGSDHPDRPHMEHIKYQIKLVNYLDKKLNLPKRIRSFLIKRITDRIRFIFSELIHTLRGLRDSFKILFALEFRKTPIFWIFLFTNMILTRVNKFGIIDWLIKIINKHYFKYYKFKGKSSVLPIPVPK